MTLVWILTSYIIYMANEDFSSQTRELPQVWFTVLYGILITLFVIRTICRLKQTGTNKNLKNVLAKRLFAQFLIEVLAVLYKINSAIITYFYTFKSSAQENIRLNLLAAVSLFSMFIRLREPYVWNTFGEIFGFSKSNSKMKFQSLSLNTFINSAMNIELVCLVLGGVRSCMNDAQEDGEKFHKMLSIQGIEFGEPEQWDVQADYKESQSNSMISPLTTLTGQSSNKASVNRAFSAASQIYVVESKNFNMKAQVVCYDAEKFLSIMLLSGVTPLDILRSLDPKKNRRNVFKAGQGAGASGSFFFFSRDKKFIIKSLQGHEKKILLSLVDDMIQHFQQNKNSKLSKIYGVFSIKTKMYASLDFVVMENVSRQVRRAN